MYPTMDQRRTNNVTCYTLRVLAIGTYRRYLFYFSFCYVYMQSMCYTSTTSPLPQNLFPPRLRPPSLIFCFLFSRAELTDSAVLLSPGEEGRRKKEKKGKKKGIYAYKQAVVQGLLWICRVYATSTFLSLSLPLSLSSTRTSSAVSPKKENSL